MASSPAGSPAPELPLPVNCLSPGVRLLSPLVLPSKSPDRATSMELPSVLRNSWPRPSARSPMPHPAPALLAVELASDPCLPRSCAPSPCCVRRGFLPLRARLFRSFLCSIPWLRVEPLAQAASCLFAVVGAVLSCSPSKLPCWLRPACPACAHSSSIGFWRVYL
jgi:hypothetical protein|uniref:Uncharacterized protein n=1 Tax=Zea mays TaxID=4577 RepID=C0PF52_MAIZE|nr:unknown [Zea mays]|eukprot:NP_001169457.1 uncharacterized protein LOC100383328 [Zea mays]